jgi:SOS response regulatory protein OraA/RecX
VARRLFALLDRRLMPVARLRLKLTGEGFGEQAVEAVLEQMRAQGLYSDQTYAAAYCRDRLAGRPVGRNFLQQKLREKQVAAAVAAQVVDAVLDAETEKELAVEAARRKWRTVRGPDARKNEQKVARHLQSRGFPAHLVWDAVRRGKPADTEAAEGEMT